MKVVILCGGQGTRLREETEFRPKPMVEIGGRPMLWHIMKHYSSYGFRDFILCLGYKGDMIRHYFLNYKTMSRSFSIHIGSGEVVTQDGSLEEDSWTVTLAETGADTMTGGRIRRIEPFVRDDERFLATYGDGLSTVNLHELIETHLQSNAVATLTGVRPAGRFGELVCNGSAVTSFNEKPDANDALINGGFFVFNRDIFSYLNGDADILERSPFQVLAATGKLSVYRHQGFWQCMDTLRDVESLRLMWDSGTAPWGSKQK